MYSLLVPLSNNNETHATSENALWMQSFTKQQPKTTEAPTLHYKLYHQRGLGTLSVTFKATNNNEAEIVVAAPTQVTVDPTANNIFSKARVLDEGNRYTNLPNDNITLLWYVANALPKHAEDNILIDSDFTHIDWLNTPGPLYTSNKNIYGSGNIISQYNIACNEQKNQVIFKQPFTKKESDKTLLALELDDYEGYYFDGNCRWNKENIIAWWDKSEERIAAILELYKQELYKPQKANNVDEDFKRPTPENYKYWLDFYECGMKKYLEWYIFQLENIHISLPEISVDWLIKEKLDKIFFLKFLSKISE
jgi:hypothetical protein